MKKAVRDTSVMSLFELMPKLGERQAAVLQTIAAFPDRTDSELTHLLNHRDPNYVRPRRYELEKSGFIRATGKRECAVTGRKAYIWRISERYESLLKGFDGKQKTIQMCFTEISLKRNKYSEHQLS